MTVVSYKPSYSSALQNASFPSKQSITNGITLGGMSMPKKFRGADNETSFSLGRAVYIKSEHAKKSQKPKVSQNSQNSDLTDLLLLKNNAYDELMNVNTIINNLTRDLSEVQAEHAKLIDELINLDPTKVSSYDYKLAEKRVYAKSPRLIGPDGRLLYPVFTFPQPTEYRLKEIPRLLTAWNKIANKRQQEYNTATANYEAAVLASSTSTNVVQVSKKNVNTDSSSQYIDKLKNIAIGSGSIKTNENSERSFKSQNNANRNTIRTALRKARSLGYVPPKKAAHR